MVISYKKKFIFIHVWKNGGTSIRNALKPYSYQVNTIRKIRYHIFNLFSLQQNNKLQLAYSVKHHSTAMEICNLMGEHDFNQFYRFAFSRNPYTRLLSQYKSIFSKETHGHHTILKKLGSFDAYVKWRIESGIETFQWQFVTDVDRNLIVDFVGKFENLSSDLCRVGNQLGIDFTLKHLNKTPMFSDKFKEGYFSSKLSDFVKIHYEKDFELFNYDIDQIPV